MAAKLAQAAGITMLMSFTVVGYAGLDRFWALFDKDNQTAQNECENLTHQQQQQLIQTYQSLRDEEKKLDLHKRMAWFCKLPDDEQLQMREAWQNMSNAERNQLKDKLETAENAEERAQIRRDFLNKYLTTN